MQLGTQALGEARVGGRRPSLGAWPHLCDAIQHVAVTPHRCHFVKSSQLFQMGPGLEEG